MKSFKFDIVLALTVLFLLIFGLIMITSIGVPKSISLSAPGVQFPNCGDPDVDCYLLFKRHVFRLLVGVIVFIGALKIPIRVWKKLTPFIFGIVVLFLVLVTIIGRDHGTFATRWIVFFNTSLQPSEFIKPALALYLAYWFSKKQKTIQSFRDGFLPFCAIAGIIVLLLMIQNDYGSVFVVCLLSGVMYFLAGARIKHLGLGLLLALIGLIIVISSVSHVRDRFQYFMKVDQECLQDHCWQSFQANVAIGSGGFWGRGLTQGVQKSYWLPQASDDFIFAASAEELGFLRIMFVVLAYLLIALRGFAISARAGSIFEKYLAAGITTWIAGQAFVNIGVNTALIPVTGITLPFVSYGGSSLVASLLGIAILLKISENTTYYANSLNRGGNRRTYRPQLRRYRRA